MRLQCLSIIDCSGGSSSLEAEIVGIYQLRHKARLIRTRMPERCAPALAGRDWNAFRRPSRKAGLPRNMELRPVSVQEFRRSARAELAESRRARLAESGSFAHRVSRANLVDVNINAAPRSCIGRPIKPHDHAAGLDASADGIFHASACRPTEPAARSSRNAGAL